MDRNTLFTLYREDGIMVPRKILMTIHLSAASAPGAEWRQRCNHKDLAGWKMAGPGRFVIEDGALKTEGGMGLLWYAGEKFGNTTLRVVFKTINQEGNSGLY